VSELCQNSSGNDANLSVRRSGSTVLHQRSRCDRRWGTATGKTTLPIRVTGASCFRARRRGTYIRAEWTNRRYGENSTLTRR